MNKLRIGIEIDEILRAKWLQFDRYYVQEFGEEGVPENQPYCFDFFKNYKWHDTEEISKELKEPEDMPEDINPIYYQTDDNGNAVADSFLFKKSETTILPAKDVYNRFMNKDYRFEIYANAPIMYKQMDLHISEFLFKYKDYADFTAFSVENTICISSTLFFLSRMSSKFRNYKFIDKATDIWKDIDIVITTNPELLELGAPWGKKIIKVVRPYNEQYNVGSMDVLQIKELTDNKNFEKIIKFKNNK
jgi:hypothetical protein